MYINFINNLSISFINLTRRFLIYSFKNNALNLIK